jgi:excisionase family DNA binding protein
MNELTTNTTAQHRQPVPAADRFLVDPETAGELISQSRTVIYQLMDDGLLAYKMIGRSRRIPTSELARFAAAGLIGGTENQDLAPQRKCGRES